jgi:methylase of polypeptide subunit release factors
MKEITFTLDKEIKIPLTISEGVFVPTGTTKLLIESVLETINIPHKILDLGCGSGVVGIALHLKNVVQQPIFASDLSQSAVKFSKLNFAKYDCRSDVRCGSLFSPWKEEKFDIIVDDISGIAKEIADVSPWFQGIPCESGEDGTSLISNIIKQSPLFLNENGKFFFPAISLSNIDALIKDARESYSNLKLIKRQEWPLPDELKPYIPLLEKLNEKKIIKLTKKFGMYIWYTEIYCAYN